MSDSTPVWSDWLPNPGTGECPVPEWHEGYEVKTEAGGGIHRAIGPDTYDWRAFAEQIRALPAQGEITHYRYAVPASLYDLAKRRKTWHIDWHPPRIDGWPRVAWLRARIDLGLCTEQEYTDPETAPGARASYRPGVEATYNFQTGEETVHNDPVNHPSHYMLAPNMEAIDVIRAALTPTEFMGYLKGSILKYRLRAGRKGDAKQDLDKADWYRAEAMKSND